jgi:hypothetical protein
MKARTDCTACRKRIYKEAETAYLQHEYKFFEESAFSMACFAAVVALSVHYRRGRSKAYIRSFFDEMCFIFDMPQVLGKSITMTEMMRFFEKEYGIDFNRIKLHLETEKEFLYKTLHDKGE